MAITLSEGRPDDEVTGLNDLWDRLEQDGVRIAINRDRRKLQELHDYGENSHRAAVKEAAEIHEENMPQITALMEWAEKRFDLKADGESGKPEWHGMEEAIEKNGEHMNNVSQIRLFGSRARGDETDRSDADIAVVTKHAGAKETYKLGRVEAPGTGKVLDITVMSEDHLRERSRYAGTCAADVADEGLTIYLGRNAEEFPESFGRLEDGTMTTRKEMLHPDEAEKYMRQARTYMKWAGDEDGCDEDTRRKCIQEGMERMLKALRAAGGKHVTHTHALNRLWDEAEESCGRIPVNRDDRLLETLSKYAGSLGYGMDTSQDEDPERTLLAGISAGNDLLEFAQSKVPDLAEETRRGLSTPEQLSRPGDLFCATSPETPFANPYLSFCCTRRTTTADSTGDGFPP